MSYDNTGAPHTTVKVIPLHQLSLRVPFYGGVSAGFPSPADDYLEEYLDVGAYLVKNQTATFFVRVQGDSMIDASIHPGDIVVVDRSLSADHNSIIIAVLNGEFTVKRLYKKGNTIKLIPANADYATIPIGTGDQFQVWGVVAHVLHRPV
ncbi:MAG: translesion error-prone DNA polymerase V autoproteolytic subunit [Bacteroidota bacterium]